MNIKVCSDLHLEFETAGCHGNFHPGEGEVLVLAGDICCARDYVDDNAMADRYDEFFNKCVDGYNKVFYTMGNHQKGVAVRRLVR